jgi:high-affinity Fe2+/Pb2+ permease
MSLDLQSFLIVTIIMLSIIIVMLLVYMAGYSRGVKDSRPW